MDNDNKTPSAFKIIIGIILIVVGVYISYGSGFDLGYLFGGK